MSSRRQGTQNLHMPSLWQDAATAYRVRPTADAANVFPNVDRGTSVAMPSRHMKSDRIDFISAYCDRWCERCAFTMRCSSYAVHVATAMCDGDFNEALALAVGKPRSTAPQEEPEPAWRRELLNMEFTPAELDETSRLEDERHTRLQDMPLTTVVSATTDLAVAWLEAHRDRLHAHAGAEVVNALDIISWDAYLIGAKIHRALDGWDRSVHGEERDEDPIQNDWNGSAKVALISIGRSAAAWDVIAAALGDREAARLAGELRDLGRDVERLFPDAWKFIRPGFDAAPSRKKRWRRR